MEQTNPNRDHDLLIQLNTKIDGISECLSGLADWQKLQEERMRAVEEKNARHSETIQAIKADVGTLKTESRGWNMVNSLAVGVATIFAYFKG